MVTPVNMPLPFPFVAFAAVASVLFSSYSAGAAGDSALSSDLPIAQQALAPLTAGLLDFSPKAMALGSAASSPQAAKYPLVLAAKRTKRPDILDKFKLYRGGWDVSNKHYWSSVGSTGVAGCSLAFIWFTSFGAAVGTYLCCKWNTEAEEKESYRPRWNLPALLLVFTFTAVAGSILLSVGQVGLHTEASNTLNFIVNQSDFTVHILINVTEYLSLAKQINIGQIILPATVQNEIDKLDLDLKNAAHFLSNKTNENSFSIRSVSYTLNCFMIVVAALTLFLGLVGFFLSIFGQGNAINILVATGWLLVSFTFVLFGAFIIFNNVIADTCLATDEWVHNPQAETTLSDVLPCVDEQNSNLTMHQSKEVIRQVVNVVNSAIGTIINSNSQASSHYNQSGGMLPLLCSPYDSTLENRQCDSQEVSFSNASLIWSQYVCEVSSSDTCISSGRVTPRIYSQLVLAVNASYALDHYTPLLLNLQNCNFVRETFEAIITGNCPRLKHELRVIIFGLAMISVGVMLCVILWFLITNYSQREELFAKHSELEIVKIG